MSYYIRLTITLLIVCAVASGILAYVNSLTEPVIRERKLQEEILTREALIPGAEFTEQTALADESFVYYIASNPENQELMGYTFIAAGNGYSGTIKTMVGLDSELKIITIKVIDQSETPGLGANCANPEFPKRFEGKTEGELQVDKDGGQIASLTGATITTRTISSSIRSQIALLKADLEAKAATGGEIQ